MIFCGQQRGRFGRSGIEGRRAREATVRARARQETRAFGVFEYGPYRFDQSICVSGFRVGSPARWVIDLAEKLIEEGVSYAIAGLNMSGDDVRLWRPARVDEDEQDPVNQQRKLLIIEIEYP